LLIYTDGFTEACNAVSEEYGVNRVRDTAQRHYAAAPDQLIAGCLSDLRNFAAGTKRTDDLSLLCFGALRNGGVGIVERLFPGPTRSICKGGRVRNSFAVFSSTLGCSGTGGQFISLLS